jgi:hypothetical protein
MVLTICPTSWIDGETLIPSESTRVRYCTVYYPDDEVSPSAALSFLITTFDAKEVCGAGTSASTFCGIQNTHPL